MGGRKYRHSRDKATSCLSHTGNPDAFKWNRAAVEALGPPRPQRSASSWETVSDDDKAIIKRQLGREPMGRYEVAYRCPDGTPGVLRVHPLLNGKPAPTLFWLTCKYLVNQVGALEVDKVTEKIRLLLYNDLEMEKLYRQNHAEYAAERWSLLSDEEVTEVATMPTMLMNAIRFSGIGGGRTWDCGKCLHQQVAHHLVYGNNAFGKWLEVNGMFPSCSPPADSASNMINITETTSYNGRTPSPETAGLSEMEAQVTELQHQLAEMSSTLAAREAQLEQAQASTPLPAAAIPHGPIQ